MEDMVDSGGKWLHDCTCRLGVGGCVLLLADTFPYASVCLWVGLFRLCVVAS